MSSPLAGSGRPTVTSPPIAAKAFGVPIDTDPRLNKVAGAPGFWIGNVIVMAGVPSIMQAMLDEVAPKLKIGVLRIVRPHRAVV